MQQSEEPGLRVDPVIVGHPGWVRLQDQLAWYDGKSHWHQVRYKRYKVVQVISAAVIPLCSVGLRAPYSEYAPAALGVLITILEGLQQLYQYNALWIQYRGTAESLKHEKFLFLAKAGPYRGMALPAALLQLSERVEELVSTEHAKWVRNSEPRQEEKEPGKG